MNVLGLDLSLTCTGYSLDRPAGLHVGTLTTRLRGCDRLTWLRTEIVALAEQADLAVIEGYSFNSRSSQAHALGELGGVVRVALHERGIAYVDVPPAIVKKYATGKGNAGKELVLVEAVKRLGYAGSSNDEADALWLHAIGRDLVGNPAVEVPQAHRAALAKLPDWAELIDA